MNNTKDLVDDESMWPKDQELRKLIREIFSVEEDPLTSIVTTPGERMFYKAGVLDMATALEKRGYTLIKNKINEGPICRA